MKDITLKDKLKKLDLQELIDLLDEMEFKIYLATDEKEDKIDCLKKEIEDLYSENNQLECDNENKDSEIEDLKVRIKDDRR